MSYIVKTLRMPQRPVVSNLMISIIDDRMSMRYFVCISGGSYGKAAQPPEDGRLQPRRVRGFTPQETLQGYRIPCEY